MAEKSGFKPFQFDKIKNDKEKTAVAVEYVPGDQAPKIIAAGKGTIAERIIEKAKENDVPLYKDDKLSATPEPYEVVAEILVFVNDVDRLKAKIDGRG